MTNYNEMPAGPEMDRLIHRAALLAMSDNPQREGETP